MCRDYIVDGDDYDFEIVMNQEMIDLERDYVEDNYNHSDAYLETIALYRAIGDILPKYNGFVLHGAAIEYKGKCFIFVAPSGTGKTTHIKMWIDYLDELKIINGDKPIIRIIDNVPVVFGTPWMGKEYMGSNDSCRLDSIVVLKRGDGDYIRKVDKQDYLQDLISKVYIPKNNMIETFDIIEQVYKNIDVYELHCTMNESAFITSFEELTGEKYEGKR